jgi:chemotaxis protein MotB
MPARARHHKDEESYFVSMTDMMVGLLFIFIIMLMYFALQFQATKQALDSVDVSRTTILEEIKQSLAEQGVQIQIFPESGLLRLPDNILFDQGNPEPKEEGKANLQKLAHALEAIIPCYAINPAGPAPATCKKRSPHRIELLYVEGHTDKDKVVNTTPRKLDNWDLSTERARNIRNILEDKAPVLGLLRSAPINEPESAPILAHVGQEATRPVAHGDDELSKSQNRRIDLRIIMAKPKPEEVEQIQSGLAVAP